ncbi:MAG: hypothetical protein ACE5HQ_10850, partial [Gemmatimonadota bacterium]
EARLVGFRAIRDRFIDALREGRYDHELRDVLAEKNLLAVGDVSADRVILLLQRCRGSRHRAGPHDLDRSLTVHSFRPVVRGRESYVKGYFLGEIAVFISVHPAER